IRSATWLFGADLGVTILAHIEIVGAKQFQIGEPPNLISHSTKYPLIAPGGVGLNNAINFRQRNKTVRREPRVRKRRIGIAGGTNQFAVVVNLNQTAGSSHQARMHAELRMLETDQHMSIGQP